MAAGQLLPDRHGDPVPTSQKEEWSALKHKGAEKNGKSNFFEELISNSTEAGKAFTRYLLFPNHQACFTFLPRVVFRLFFKGTFQKWLKQTPVLQGLQDSLQRSLLTGDIQTLGETFQKLVTQVLSYHDTKSDQTESFYHAFMLGLLIQLKDRYRIRSNREEGFGRYDIQLLPEDKTEPG